MSVIYTTEVADPDIIREEEGCVKRYKDDGSGRWVV